MANKPGHPSNCSCTYCKAYQPTTIRLAESIRRFFETGSNRDTHHDAMVEMEEALEQYDEEEKIKGG